MGGKEASGDKVQGGSSTLRLAPWLDARTGSAQPIGAVEPAFGV